MAAAELLGLAPVIGAPNDPDFAVGLVLASRDGFRYSGRSDSTSIF